MASAQPPSRPQAAPDGGSPTKGADAFRTISEVADELRLPQHVLRFWETRFPQVKPMKRAGCRRFYRPEDVALLRAVQALLYDEGYTIKGVQRLLAEFGARHVADALARSRVKPASPSLPAAPARNSPVDREGEPTGREAEFARLSGGVGPDERATAERHRSTRDGLVERLNAVLDDLGECARLIASVQPTES